MIDTVTIKEQLDCREVIARDLGPGKKSGKWLMFPCPYHADGTPSLGVVQDGWKCFGCGESGDVIGWVMKYHSKSFQDAALQLGAPNTIGLARKPTPRPAPAPVASEGPAPEWCEAAANIAYDAHQFIWTDAGKPARQWLNDRGIQDFVIDEAKLGYMPGHHTSWEKMCGLSVPCGITIPRFVGQDVWSIKVRRAAGKPKYQQIGGGKAAGALYWADYVRSGPLLITEGEFDCLIAWSLPIKVYPVTQGSATDQIDCKYWPLLCSVPRFLTCYDADAAGSNADEHWAKVTDRAWPIKPLQGKDLNEFYLQAGPNAVSDWLLSEVEQAYQPTYASL